MQINTTNDISVALAPVGFLASVNQAVQFLEQTFTSAITINIEVGWGEIGGTKLPSGVTGEGGPVSGALYTYRQVTAALASNINSPADATAVADLPVTDPTNGGSFFIGRAQQKALGLIGATASGLDGAVGFQGDVGIGTIEHEITHAMGRIADLGTAGNFHQFSVLDLFRYTGAGIQSPTALNGAYFSADGGKTAINTFDSTSDPGDWAGATVDAFNAFGGPADPVSPGDIEEMNILGFASAAPTGQLITLGSAPQTVTGAAGDTIVGGSGAAVINATAGSISVVGGSGPIEVFGGFGDTIAAGSGNAYIDGSAGDMAIRVGSGGTDTIIGSISAVAGIGVDTITGGAAAVQVQGLGRGDIVNFAGQSGNSTVNATAGNIAATFGGGSATVIAGAGDTVSLGSVSQYVNGLAGGAKIAVGSGGTDIIIGAMAPAAGAGADTITGGTAAVQVQGLGKGDVVNFAGQSGNASVNATAGNIAATLGSGAATVYGGAGDTINLGSGNQYVDGLMGGSMIAAGSLGGFDIIIGSMARVAGNGVDTLTGGAAAAQVQGLGKGDVVNFAGQTGNASVNATAGNIAVTLGAGAASVYGGAGDTINLGSGNQYVDARQGGATTGGGAGALITLGSAGSDNIIGSTVPGAGVTIKGGKAALNYNPGAGNDLIDLSGTTGPATINAFGFDNGPLKDTVIAGNGSSSVWGGMGDRIGVGSGAGGTHLFTHATTIKGASIAFGTSDTVVAASYGTVPGAVTVNGGLAGASSARVTVSGFAEAGGTPTDFIFYPNETVSQNAAIVATSTQISVNGAASTQFTLPDGTVTTLTGVPKADFNTAFFAA